jgi:hypothetical protein
VTPGYCLASRSDAVARRRRTSLAFDVHPVCIAGRTEEPGGRGENAAGSPNQKPARWSDRSPPWLSSVFPASLFRRRHWSLGSQSAED